MNKTFLDTLDKPTNDFLVFPDLSGDDNEVDVIDILEDIGNMAKKINGVLVEVDQHIIDRDSLYRNHKGDELYASKATKEVETIAEEHRFNIDILISKLEVEGILSDKHQLDPGEKLVISAYNGPLRHYRDEDSEWPLRSHRGHAFLAIDVEGKLSIVIRNSPITSNPESPYFERFSRTGFVIEGTDNQSTVKDYMNLIKYGYLTLLGLSPARIEENNLMKEEEMKNGFNESDNEILSPTEFETDKEEPVVEGNEQLPHPFKPSIAFPGKVSLNSNNSLVIETKSVKPDESHFLSPATIGTHFSVSTNKGSDVTAMDKLLLLLKDYDYFTVNLIKCFIDRHHQSNGKAELNKAITLFNEAQHNKLINKELTMNREVLSKLTHSEILDWQDIVFISFVLGLATKENAYLDTNVLKVMAIDI